MPPEGSPYGRTKQSYTGRRRDSRAAANSTVLGFRRLQRVFLNISAAAADVVRLRRPSVSVGYDGRACWRQLRRIHSVRCLVVPAICARPTVSAVNRAALW